MGTTTIIDNADATPPSTALLRSLPPPPSFLSSPVPTPLFLAGGTWLPGRRSVRPHPRSRATPAARFLQHPPSPRAPPLPTLLDTSLPSSILSLPSSLPVPVSPPLPRCILNQSLGGNAITRHHDASTIFYFKLLYVLVPPPCFLPADPSFVITPRRHQGLRLFTPAPPTPRQPLLRQCPSHPRFAALLFCLGSSCVLCCTITFLLSRPRSSGLSHPLPPQHKLVTRLFY